MDVVRDKKRGRQSSSNSAPLPVRKSTSDGEPGPSFRLPKGFESLFAKATTVTEKEKPAPKKRRERIPSSERMDVGPSARLESRLQALAQKKEEEQKKADEMRERMEQLQSEKERKRAQAKLRARAKERAEREGITVDEALRLNMEESAERKRKVLEAIEKRLQQRRIVRARRQNKLQEAENQMQVDEPGPSEPKPSEAGPSRRRKTTSANPDAEMRAPTRAELRKEAAARERAEAEALAEAKRRAEEERRENKKFVKEEMDPLTALLSRTTLMGGKKKSSRKTK